MKYLEPKREGNSLLKALPFPMGKIGGFRPVPKFGKGGTKCRKGGYQMQKRGVPNAEKGGTKCRKLKNVNTILAPERQVINPCLRAPRNWSIFFIVFIDFIKRKKLRAKAHVFSLLKGEKSTGGKPSESPLFWVSLQRGNFSNNLGELQERRW